MVDFTEPYFEADQGVLVQAGTEVATVEDARALQWGVQSGTTGLDYANGGRTGYFSSLAWAPDGRLFLSYWDGSNTMPHVSIRSGTAWARHAADYEAAIERAGGIDFQILGIGKTGHIGFNEPGSGPDTRTRLVTLDTITRKDAAADFFFDYSSVGIPAAPNGAGTRGLKLQANLTNGIFSGMSVSPTGQNFTGDYRLTASVVLLEEVVVTGTAGKQERRARQHEWVVPALALAFLVSFLTRMFGGP